jgi:hypothetical protein
MLIIKEEHFDKLMQVRALKQSQTSNTALLDMYRTPFVAGSIQLI